MDSSPPPPAAPDPGSAPGTGSASEAGSAPELRPASQTGPASGTGPASDTRPASETGRASQAGPASETGRGSETGPASGPGSTSGVGSTTSPRPGPVSQQGAHEAPVPVPGPADGGPRVPPARAARERTFLRVGGPADLVAAVPYLVGFQPVHSVVVISLRGARLRCGLVARMDVPAPADVEPWADGLASFVLRDSPREVVVLIYHDRTWSRVRRPFGPAVDAVERRFAAAGVPMKDALYVTADRFWSYTCAEQRCCPPDGTPLAAGRSSALAAAYVAEGRAPMADRGAVVGRLDGGPPEVLAATREAAYEALDLALSWERPDLPGHWQMWQTGTADLFSALVRRRLDGDTREPGAEEVARVVAGLLDRTTRDLVALRSTGWVRALPSSAVLDPDDPMEGLADDPGTNLAELRRLFRGCAGPEDPRCATPQGQEEVAHVLATLCRSCDGELAVAPLVLAGMQAWASGDGVMATAAAERALTLDPGCTMAGLLCRLMEHGIAPAWVERDRAEDEAAPPRQDG
jgi:hypothetical protein